MVEKKSKKTSLIKTGHTQLSLEPGSPAWDAAKEMTQTYQEGISSIREGREKVGHKLADLWNDWYNSLMVICFGLGGALIALMITLNFNTVVNQVLFVAGACMLILNGLSMLLIQKRILEKESTDSISMGYEIEYYSMVARNRAQDPLNGISFNETEYEEAKDKLLKEALSSIENSYEESRKINTRMDVFTTTFILSLALLVLSSITNMLWLLISSIGTLIGLLAIQIFFRRTANEVKAAVDKRDVWLDKIKIERKRNM